MTSPATANEIVQEEPTALGFDSQTGIYHSVYQLDENYKIPTSPNLDIATFVLSQFPRGYHAESRVAFIDSATGAKLTYGQLNRSIRALGSGLYHELGIRKNDVVFVLSPNTIFYPVICLAIFSIGAILTPANPLNTEAEIAKQIHDSGAVLAIAAAEEIHKLVKTRIPVIQTHSKNELSVEKLIHRCNPGKLPEITELSQSDTAAILYSSGTTGTSKGVVLTHGNLIAIVRLMKWSVDVSNSQNDVYLCFIPIFHIYGLAFFGLGLFSSGITTVMMKKFELQGMLEAIETYKVNNIPAVPPVILGLVKYESTNFDLSSLKRMGSGAAPLSKELTHRFSDKYPWVELRQGYGLTESSGASCFHVSSKEAKANRGSCGKLMPSFSAKVVDNETGLALPPCKEGELWIKSPTIMKGYLGNEEATRETLDEDGWLKTGDLCYFDENGFCFIVDRIKELIKHNGYQVAPAELEAILLSHPQILDAAVIPIEDEEAGQLPMACVVKSADSELSEDQVIQYVASQVAPYKKVRRVGFITAIPKSAAGKILRKQLISDIRQQRCISKL